MLLLLLAPIITREFSTGLTKGAPNFGVYQVYYKGSVKYPDTLELEPVYIAPYEFKSIYIRGDSLAVYYKIAPVESELDSVDWKLLVEVLGATTQPAYYEGWSIPVATYVKFRITSLASPGSGSVFVFYLTLWKQPIK